MNTSDALQENELWRKERFERCRDPNGWLALAGLSWLEEGENSFGGAESNKVVFEVKSAPPRLGKIVLTSAIESTKAIFHPIEGVEVKSKGLTVAEPLALLHDEQSDGPTVLTYGSLSWFLVLRSGGHLGIRLKDSESEVLKNFRGIDMFPLDLKWRIEADFIPHEPAKVLRSPNAIGEMTDSKSPGLVSFKIDGVEYNLDVTGNPEVKAFIIFADATTRKSTYGGGRYLYASGPVVIDFNQSYNPPCVFSDFAVCTYAHEANKLTMLAIEAGEKIYRSGQH